MDKKKYYELTEEGKKKLEEELVEYTKEGGIRDKNVEAIKDARAQGDLSENADYDAARDEQARIEARINELKEILKNVKIISVDSTDKVSTGKFVTLKFSELNGDESFEQTLAIVGTIEADPLNNNSISNECPLGAAIIGHHLGDSVTVVADDGHEFKVQILAVKNSAE